MECQVEDCQNKAEYWLFNSESPFKIMVCSEHGVMVCVYRKAAFGDKMQLRVIKEETPIG